MMSTRTLQRFAAVCIMGLLPLVAAAQGIDSYQPVTEARLLNPEPENWLMYRRTYDGWGYSPLDRINTLNVQKLAPVWSYSTGVIEGHQSPIKTPRMALGSLPGQPRNGSRYCP